MPLVLVLIVVVLALFRVVRLIIEDEILEPVRERTIFKLNPQGKLRALFDCPWCLSVWLSIPAAYLCWQWPTLTFWLALPFAFSAIVGLISSTQ